MPFQRIAIWGLGLMGGSLAAALRSRDFEGVVVGISSQDSVSRAVRADLIDEGYPHAEFTRGVEGADLVVLASPIDSIIQNLNALAPVLPRGTVVTDVGSTKSAICSHARGTLPEGVLFVGSHPMAGSESKGIGAADALLYENAVWVLTPEKGQEESEAVESLSALAERVGAKVVVTDPVSHDRIASRISHLPQTLAVVLMNSAGDWNEEDDLTLRLAAGGFRDLTRIASSPWGMWADVYSTNRSAILDALDAFMGGLTRIREAVASEGDEMLEEEFQRANALRLSVPRDTKGFVRPLCDIMVVVRDEPGVLSRIAGSLVPHDINIRDIEVLKVREGEGGTMRLAFDGEQTARDAVRHLKEEGFRAWVRE
ncbi:MAG: prephenate dehydrogenase [bacterium]